MEVLLREGVAEIRGNYIVSLNFLSQFLFNYSTSDITLLIYFHFSWAHERPNWKGLLLQKEDVQCKSQFVYDVIDHN